MMANYTEALFVGSAVKEGWPLNIYEAGTGATIWSHRGTELQGEMPGQSIIVADEYVLTTITGRPVISNLSMQSKNRTHFRSFTPGPVQCLAATSDGSICCGASGEKIYTWMICNGSLTSITNAHYQAVTKLRFTTDGSFLISSGKDGRIMAWNLVDLLQPETSAIKKTTSANRVWTGHSLPVTDLKVGFGGVDARVYSVSLDQSAKIHSLQSDQLLTSLIFDCALSACCVDDAETRFFIGTAKGDIFQVNLFTQPVARERHIQTAVENVENPVFQGHKQKVTELSMNSDSTLLASGSEDQTVRIWHAGSRQCLRTIQTQGPVVTLLFIPRSPVITNRDYVCSHPIQPFQKQLRADDVRGQIVVKLKKTKIDGLNEKPDDADLDRMLDDLRKEEELSIHNAMHLDPHVEDQIVENQDDEDGGGDFDDQSQEAPPVKKKKKKLTSKKSEKKLKKNRKKEKRGVS